MVSNVIRNHWTRDSFPIYENVHSNINSFVGGDPENELSILNYQGEFYNGVEGSEMSLTKYQKP